MPVASRAFVEEAVQEEEAFGVAVGRVRVLRDDLVTGDWSSHAADGGEGENKGGSVAEEATEEAHVDSPL